MPLSALPAQPPDAPWPSREWPVGAIPDGVDGAALEAVIADTFAEPQPSATTRTHDLLIVHRGRIVAERYAPEFGPHNTQPSWSMAKSILHAIVGVLVREGALDISAPAPVAAWQSPEDERGRITLDSLLHMTSGLRFTEDYVNDDVSDVIKMLFRPGHDDMAAFAASFPAESPPDRVFNYSSGTTNIISGIVKTLTGGGERYREFLQRELFRRIGMTSPIPRFDASGSWIASSFCFCTPRDFARFGLLYLRDGVWDGERILPRGWVDYARTPAPVQPAETDLGYGAHWWLLNDDLGSFAANGYAGQHIVLVPPLDLIIVRNGDTLAERRPQIWAQIRTIIDLFRPLARQTTSTR